VRDGLRHSGRRSRSTGGSLHALSRLSLLLALSGCSTVSYLAQQGVGQLRIMHSRRRISEVLGDPAVAADVKSRLKLAFEARRFGVEVLGLRDGDLYTRFVDLHGHPLAWNVWAAPKDSLTPHRHKFPLAGSVPYLGYFRERDALRERDRLMARGFDTYVGEVSGYSTLGVTADPIFSSMLEGSPAHIVEVTLHEMLHGTVYLAGHSEWNESLATFVGLNGAALFFAMREGGPAARQVFAEAAERASRERRFRHFLEPFLCELEALYKSPRSLDEKLHLREEIFTRLRSDYATQFPAPVGHKAAAFARAEINNALLAVFGTYHRAGPEHERILRKLHGDLHAFVRLYKHAVDDEDHPLDWLRAYAVRASTK
jgi:predicted aminopeptidase